VSLAVTRVLMRGPYPNVVQACYTYRRLNLHHTWHVRFRNCNIPTQCVCQSTQWSYAMRTFFV